VTTDQTSLTDRDTPESESMDDDTSSEVTETEAEDSAADTEEAAAQTASQRSLAVLLTVAALAVLLVASAGAAIWLYFASWRPDQATDEAAKQAAIEAAKTGTVAALSYSPDELDTDLETAKSYMTGDFLDYYTKFTDEVVRKAVADKKVSTVAQVMRAAVSEIEPDHAKVLVFVNQATTSSDRPDPSMSASSVVVTLTKVDGKWLISAFDPV
jgi:Mce-associated membrane protein